MQEQDIITSTYWADNERFADIMNVGLFKGKKVLSAKQLEERDSNSLAIADRQHKKKGIQKRRDILKKANFGTNFILFGVENQMHIHRAMPVRIMGYEFLGYDKQLKDIRREHERRKDLTEGEYISGFSEDDKLNPICTLVIYYGQEPWEEPSKLSEILNFEELPDDVRKLVVDYPIHVIDARRFADSEKLVTDARLLFGILKRENDANEVEAYAKENQEAFQNVCEDTFDAIGILTSHENLMKIKDKTKNEEGGYNMCEAFRQMEERGEKLGEKRGLEMGEDRMGKLIQALMKDNLFNEIQLVTTDSVVRKKYYERYGIQ